jgi:hypothetical protein
MLDLEKIRANYTDENLEHVGEADTLIQAIMHDIPDLLAEVERLRKEAKAFWVEWGDDGGTRLPQVLAVLEKAKRELVSHRAERDEANANAARLRADRDHWRNAAAVRRVGRDEALADRDHWKRAAHTLRAEFAKADNRAIEAAERAASMRDELQALSWIAKRIEDMANDRYQARLEDDADDREKLIAAIGELQKEVRIMRGSNE